MNDRLKALKHQIRKLKKRQGKLNVTDPEFFAITRRIHLLEDIADEIIFTLELEFAGIL